VQRHQTTEPRNATLSAKTIKSISFPGPDRRKGILAGRGKEGREKTTRYKLNGMVSEAEKQPMQLQETAYSARVRRKRRPGRGGELSPGPLGSQPARAGGSASHNETVIRVAAMAESDSVSQSGSRHLSHRTLLVVTGAASEVTSSIEKKKPGEPLSSYG